MKSVFISCQCCPHLVESVLPTRSSLKPGSLHLFMHPLFITTTSFFTLLFSEFDHTFSGLWVYFVCKAGYWLENGRPIYASESPIPKYWKSRFDPFCTGIWLEIKGKVRYLVQWESALSLPILVAAYLQSLYMSGSFAVDSLGSVAVWRCLFGFVAWLAWPTPWWLLTRWWRTSWLQWRSSPLSYPRWVSAFPLAERTQHGCQWIMIVAIDCWRMRTV